MSKEGSKPAKSSHVVVVGASAGGTEALAALLEGLPGTLPAGVLIVRHLSPESSAAHLASRLKRHTPMPCREAKDGENLLQSHVYIAPANNHLLVNDGQIWVVHGPRENRWRPAVDALFRSAAVSHGNRVIGIVLSGSLDDGTAGLSAIKRCGGRCIVQDPDDAAYPEMPKNALNNVAVDHCLPVSEIPKVVVELLAREQQPAPLVPPDILAEARIVSAARSDVETVESIGTRSMMTCPDCGGVLWQLNGDGFPRFRCHTGHAFSSLQLLEGQSAKIEETLWRALRMFEERRNLLRTIHQTSATTPSVAERIKDSEVDIRRLRDLLKKLK
jgi:two-component system, chemotaxis family, protein-glutamate methylesterase/glutaminase